jgi:hypothetical protein
VAQEKQEAELHQARRSQKLRHVPEDAGARKDAGSSFPNVIEGRRHLHALGVRQRTEGARTDAPGTMPGRVPRRQRSTHLSRRNIMRLIKRKWHKEQRSRC